jgi:hypothetical protein
MEDGPPVILRMPCEMLAWNFPLRKANVGEIVPDRLEEFGRCLRIISGMMMNIKSLSARFIKSSRNASECIGPSSREVKFCE